LDQRRQRFEGLFRLGAFSLDEDRGAFARAEHQKPHDGAAADSQTVLLDRDFRVELFRGLYESSRGAGMKAARVHDGDFREALINASSINAAPRAGRRLLVWGHNTHMAYSSCLHSSITPKTLDNDS